jgi:hypothetical protein
MTIEETQIDELMDRLEESGIVTDAEAIAEYKAHADLVSNVALALILLHDADDGIMPNPMSDKITKDMLVYGESADGGQEIAKRLKVGMTPKEANQTIKEATDFIHAMYVDMVTELLDDKDKDTAREN